MLEFFVNIAQVFFFRYNGGIPEARFWEVSALNNHEANKTRFASFAPELVELSSEIEIGIAPFSTGKILVLADIAFFRFDE